MIIWTAQRRASSWSRAPLPPFFFLVLFFFFPGLEIIALQCEVRRKEEGQKSDRLNKDKPLAIKCSHLDEVRHHGGGEAAEQWEH